MKRIEQLPKGVRGCAVVPQTGHDDWWVMTGNVLVGVDPLVYVSKTGCEELAKIAGWLDPAVRDELTEALAAVQQRVGELEEELEHERRINEAIDVIESKDFRARKRAGRKPKVKEEVAA